MMILIFVVLPRRVSWFVNKPDSCEDVDERDYVELVCVDSLYSVVRVVIILPRRVGWFLGRPD